MNKPAAKDPSMDEILSSIRQIIADEDEVPVAEKPAAAAEAVATPEEEEDDAPLALSPEQMLPDDEPDVVAEEAVEAAESDDDELLGGLASFSPVEQPQSKEDEPEPEEAEPVMPEESLLVEDAEADSEPVVEDEPGIVLADDISFDEGPEEEADLEPEPAPVAPMPDPDLSSDMADKLLEPTAAAATRHAFSRLGQLSVGTSDLTIENLVRDMLRPMLKDWLDENLPSVVEKLVEREIERISRGS